jgi:hypothetical protein
MTLAAILDVLGFSEQELWGDDLLGRLCDRRDRLQRQLAQRHRKLVRQRRIIETIREHLQSDQRCATPEKRSRLGKLESIYQDTLSEYAEIKRRLTETHRRIGMKQIASH